MANTPRLDPVSTKRQRIAELAGNAPEMVFTSLAHHIDLDLLRAAYVATRKDGAVGLDGQTMPSSPWRKTSFVGRERSLMNDA